MTRRGDAGRVVGTMASAGRLQDFPFADGYRSGANDLAGELFLPALSRATSYDRAAGFFSSSVISVLGAGLRCLFAEGGRVTLVISPKLDPQDISAIAKFYIQRAQDYADRSVPQLIDDLLAKRLNSPSLFGELLRRGLVRLYVARPRNDPSPAIYHEKMAIFSDGVDALAISGSGNESALALRGSFERFEVFRSWREGERAAAFRFQRQFDELVANQTDGLEVVPLLDAYLEGWLEARTTPPTDEQAPTMVTSLPKMPELLVPLPIKLFRHQDDAISKWAEAGGRGMLAMATGSGKTITALSLASRLCDALAGKPLAILIIAPFIHLVDQWIGVAKGFGLRPIRCAEGEDLWRDDLSTAIFAANAGRRPVLSVAVTAASLQSATFQRLLGRLRVPLLVIGDEAHNYGSAKIASMLPPEAPYRVGLSATPEKWMDPEGTARIHAYFGPTVSKYDLSDALRDEVLTPYDYSPVLVELDAEEVAEYEEISAKLARFGISEDADNLSEGAKSLLMRRARVLASAKAKLPILRRMLEPMKGQTHILIYCGDGRSDGDADAMPAKQIDQVVRIAEDLGIICAKYTAETPAELRTQLLDRFDQGRIQALIAIRCLDEGVDVPSTRTAFILSSSTNPRQFIQRRGRVLRRSPATGKRKAEIFDFFVIPPLDGSDHTASRAMQGAVKRQLQRVVEFSNLALNGPEARKTVLDWTKEHGLLRLWGS